MILPVETNSCHLDSAAAIPDRPRSSGLSRDEERRLAGSRCVIGRRGNCRLWLYQTGVGLERARAVCRVAMVSPGGGVRPGPARDMPAPRRGEAALHPEAARCPARRVR